MKKRTKASKKRLNNLLIILLLTAVLLIMSTYAWFTANRVVNIDSIDVQVATSSGLQISADGITWKTVLNKDDLLTAHTTYAAVINQLPELMSPVSTAMDLNAFGQMRMFYGQVKADLESDPDAPDSTYGKYLLKSIPQSDVASYTVTAEMITANEYAKGYYIAFDVFLKDEIQADNLYVTGSVKETGTVVKGLENAARVAIIKGDNFPGPIDTTDATVQAIQALTTVDGYKWLWEPNCDSHTQNAIDNARSLNWYTDRFTAGTLFAGSGNAKLLYDGLKTNFNDTSIELSKATSVENPDHLTEMKPDWSTTKAGKLNGLLREPAPTDGGGNPTGEEAPVALAAGVTKYRIYMWVEGQDIDCENYASGTDISYELSFSLDPFN